MKADVDLYRSDDYVLTGRVPIAQLLRPVFEPLVGQPLTGCRFHLSFLGPADERPLEGMPTLVNLKAKLGYVEVRIERDDVVFYRHPHAVREIIARPLQALLAERFPGETHWGFSINGPGLERAAVRRPAPTVDNEFEIVVRGTRPAAFHIEQVAALAPPQATLADLGVEAAAGPPAGRVGVVLRPHAFKHLTAGPFSSEVETGGFLAGYVFRDQDREGCHLLEVTGAIPAERTGASLLQFTFTGESFLRMSDQLVRRGQRERLVGWYHTHLFPASDALGLSSIDVELHHGTFRLPWQVAGLINLDAQTRVLRFYQERQDDSSTGATMEVVPYWVANGIRRPPAVGADDEG